MIYSRLLFSAILTTWTSILYGQHLVWTEVAEGVWKTEIGEGEKFDLFSAAGINPNLEAIRAVGSAVFPFEKDAVSGNIVEGKTNLRLPLEKDEQLFGFGLNFKTIHQRGRILE
ncbi:MAG: ABC transporter substrate-binding protein, partial [Cyclobacteriaceae bacterium]